jgi:hypothetical protein
MTTADDTMAMAPARPERRLRGSARLPPTLHGIIWISSYPKSGKTWIRAFIHNLMKELDGDTGGAQAAIPTITVAACLPSRSAE